MIEKKMFEEKMKEICMLIGFNPLKSQIDAFYLRLKNYEAGDFIRACSEDEMLDELNRKLSYPCIRKYVEKYRDERMLREQEMRKKKEESDARKIIEKEGIPPEIKELFKRLSLKK